MTQNKVYDKIGDVDCARFSYNGTPRVVRVIAIEKGNITGYETKKGGKIVNRRFAPVKSFKVIKIDGGKFTIGKR
jgi:hypothetical protein